MTHADVQMVLAYTAKNGPLSPMRMYDKPAALIAFLLSKSMGNDPKSPYDFMPFQQSRDTINFEE